MTRTRPNRVTTSLPSELASVAWPDAIGAAVAFLTARLRDPDVTIGMEAAKMLIDLEKTRMRHGQEIAGTIPHIAAGLPAGVITTNPNVATDSPPNVLDADSPAGKPAAMCSSDEPTERMTLDEILADPEMGEVIRQTRREMERADPTITWTDESVGRMLFEQMRELRATPQARSSLHRAGRGPTLSPTD